MDDEIPESIMSSFRKHCDYNLRLKDEVLPNFYLDFDKFMDQAIILYLRFNSLCKDPLNLLYFAWTLFSVEYVDFD